MPGNRPLRDAKMNCSGRSVLNREGRVALKRRITAPSSATTSKTGLTNAQEPVSRSISGPPKVTSLPKTSHEKAQMLVDDAVSGQAYADLIGQCDRGTLYPFKYNRCGSSPNSAVRSQKATVFSFAKLTIRTFHRPMRLSRLRPDTGLMPRGKLMPMSSDSVLTKVCALTWVPFSRLPWENCLMAIVQPMDVIISSSQQSAFTQSTHQRIQPQLCHFKLSVWSVWTVSGGISWQSVGSGTNITFTSQSVGWFFTACARKIAMVALLPVPHQPDERYRCIPERQGGWAARVLPVVHTIVGDLFYSSVTASSLTSSHHRDALLYQDQRNDH